MTFNPGDPKPPNAGRKPGTPNKDTAMIQELVDKLDMHPAEVLAHVATGNAVALGLVEAGSHPADSILAIPISLRVKAASELCSYLLPKRKAVEISANEDRPGGVLLVPAPITMDQWQKFVEQSHVPNE